MFNELMIKNENPSSSVWRLFASFKATVEVLVGEVDNFHILLFFLPLISLNSPSKKSS